VFQSPGPWLEGADRILVGDRVFARPFIRLEALPSSGSPATGPILTIGDGAYLGFHLQVFATRAVRIGRDVYVNGHVTIYDHYPPLDAGPPVAGGIAPPHALVPRVGEVSIGDRAWLGWGSVVLPGARIGTHAVLGANSVAMEDIPDYCVAVGNPAVVIRRYEPAQGAWVSVDPRRSA
jgi:acetyltransferase-like isoleucine patch superfamily enzyme